MGGRSIVSSNHAPARRRIRGAMLLAACVCAWGGMGAPAGTAAAGNGGNMGMENGSVQESKLGNGLTLIAKEAHSAPVVSVFVWYRVGSRNEEPGQSGLAHFLEHMLFKGTRKFPKGEIARLIGRTGGEQNAFTSYDYTAYYETVPAASLGLALEIEADRMRDSLLDPGEMEKERTVILSELEGNRNHPEVRLRDLVNAQSWLHHPYRRPVIGWREEVERLTNEQMRAFYRRYYRPDNAALVVVGDFDPAELRRLAEREFGSIPNPAAGPGYEPVGEEPQGGRRAELNDHGQNGLVRLQIAIPPAGHPDQYALTVLNDVLTSGKSSRLYRALVDRGLAAEISASPQEMIDNGAWVFSATCPPGVAPEKLETALRAELAKAADTPLTPLEYERAQNQTRARLIYARDSLTDQAMMLGFYQTVARDWRLFESYPDRAGAVTRDQVLAAARRYLDPDRMTFGLFKPLPGKAPGGAPGRAAGDTVSWRPTLNAEARFGALPPLPAPPAGASGSAAAGNGDSRRVVLANGLVLLLQVNRSNPTVCLSGVVRGGVVSEPADLPGLATVHAQMLDRGTRRRTAARLAADLEFKSAMIDYSSGPEELNLSGEALAADLDLLLTAVAETLSEPTFPAAELAKVRREALTACRQAQDSSQSQAWKGFTELAYPEGHPLRRSLISAEPGIRKLGRGDLQAYHRRWIRPDATILSLAGDLDPQAVEALAVRRFGAWTAAGPAPTVEVAPMAPVAGIRTAVKRLAGKRESIVILGHEGIRRLDPEYYDAFVANHVLGGSGLSSQLMRTVRDRDGLTYSIYSQFRLARGPRPWIVVFQCDPAKTDQAVALVRDQVRSLQAGKVDEAEVDDAREELVGGLLIGLETSRGIAYLNREIEYQSLGGDYLRRFPEAVRAVSRARLIAAAGKWLHPDRYLQSVVAPEEPGPNR